MQNTINLLLAFLALPFCAFGFLLLALTLSGTVRRAWAHFARQSRFKRACLLAVFAAAVAWGGKKPDPRAGMAIPSIREADGSLHPAATLTNIVDAAEIKEVHQ